VADEAQGEQARDRSEERRLTCHPKPSAAIKSQSEVINRNQSSSSRNQTHPRPSAPRWPHGPQLRSRLSAVALSEDPVGNMTRDVISGNQRSSEIITSRSFVPIRFHQWQSEVIRGHQRSSEAIGPRLWGIRRRSKVHQLQRAARGPRGARYGARARARRTVRELLLAQHGAERAEPFHRREGRIGARRVGDKIPDEGRKQRSSTGPSAAIKTPSRRNQGAIKGRRVLGEGGEGH